MTSSSEVADCTQLNIFPFILSLSKHVEELKDSKCPLQSQYKVCAFWATVETWWCNMSVSMKQDILPLLILKAHSKVTKARFLFSDDYTLLKTYSEYCTQFLSNSKNRSK